jgi:hypothetical protein
MIVVSELDSIERSGCILDDMIKGYTNCADEWINPS